MKLSRALLIGTCIGFGVLSSGAYAQTTSSSADDQAVRDGEIVVTATRQSETISRVPISITALSQENLDSQGVRNIDDVTRFTPGLSLTRNGFGTQANISIRGISSNIGAGTVGVYVDDTPIQTRSIGYTSTNTYPALFDLERLEVLRGPQGTLFGAGSMGGTIRFITPAPSLTDFSSYARAEFGVIDGGATNYEAGGAVGGPLVEDKLGFRASVSYRRDGGWIDRVNKFSGEVLDKNANRQDTIVARAAITWAPAPNLLLTPSILYQGVRLHDTYTYWDALSDPGDNVYRNGQRVRQYDNDHYILPALKAEYNGDGFDIISNTSYFDRKHKPKNDYTNLMVGLYADANTLPELPDYESYALMQNRYRSFTQEVRIQSNDPGARLTWVLGVFYNKLKQNANEQIIDPMMGDLFQLTLGHGVLEETGMELIDGQYSLLAEFQTVDKQLATFGEVTYELFDGFRVIGGLRYSRSRYSANNYVTGPFNYATFDDSGKGGENPVTPKFGLSWQVDPDNLLYATIAKGFRVGGVNPPIPIVPCQVDLDSRGYTDGTPTSYESDTLWSYEAGVKSRLFGGGTRVAASAFHIKWNNIQRNIYLSSCALQFTDNLGAVNSNGFDLSVTQRLFEGFNINAQVAYTDATYAKDIYGRPDRLPQVRKGNAIDSQPWTVVLGAEYRTPIGSGEGYARVDYNYRGGNALTSGLDPETSSYDPNSFARQATNNVNLRIGAEMGDFDLSVFANNLTNNHPALTHYAEGGDPIFRETTLTPRTIGATLTHRY